jgi:hypothetical protein
MRAADQILSKWREHVKAGQALGDMALPDVEKTVMKLFNFSATYRSTVRKNTNNK